MYFNRKTSQIAIFIKISGDLIIDDEFRPKYAKTCIESGQMGKPLFPIVCPKMNEPPN